MSLSNITFYPLLSFTLFETLMIIWYHIICLFIPISATGMLLVH